MSYKLYLYDIFNNLLLAQTIQPINYFINFSFYFRYICIGIFIFNIQNLINIIYNFINQFFLLLSKRTPTKP